MHLSLVRGRALHVRLGELKHGLRALQVQAWTSSLPDRVTCDVGSLQSVELHFESCLEQESSVLVKRAHLKRVEGHSSTRAKRGDSDDVD